MGHYNDYITEARQIEDRFSYKKLSIDSTEIHNQKYSTKQPI